jgi:hypothetical protein
LFNEPVPKPGWFWPGSWKNRSKARFSPKSKEAVPKTEVLEQPLITSVIKQLPLENSKMQSILQDLFNNQPGY